MADLSTTSQSAIDSKDDFKPDKSGQYSRWKSEMDASEKMLESFHKKGTKVVERYVDQRKSSSEDEFRLNLFWSNVSTQKSMLFGNLPKVEVSRTYADADDDAARVASEMMERILTLDVEENGEEYTSVLRSCVEDRLLPGLSCARVRYEMESEEVEQPAIMDDEGNELAAATTQTRTTYEDVELDYYFWKDVRWSWTRNWKDLRWLAFRNYLTKDEIKERFPKCKADDFTYKKMSSGGDPKDESSADDSDIWNKAEIWEIWDRINQKVIFWSEGYDEILETKDDPLGLRGFFPCPPFMMANTTTSLMVPVPDFCMAQDLYNKIDEIETRLSILTDAVKVVGVYDKNNEGLDKILTEGIENQLVPVDNWAMFAEKGGLKGSIDWLPLDQVVVAIEKLRELRDDNIGLLNMLVGMADVMRGQTQPANARTPQAETAMAAKFGSVRIQSLQEEIARFITDLMQLKCEVIAKHFEPGNIVKLSNMQFTPDKDKIPAAIDLIKNTEDFYVRVIVRPESVAMVDYAQLQQERSEYISSISLFLQSAAGLVETVPESGPVLMEMLKWGLAGFKGSNQIEGVLDRAIAGMQKSAQQPGQQKPDPEAVKAQAAMQLAQIKAQGEQQKLQMQHQNEMQVQQLEFQNTMKEIMAKMQADMQIIQAKFQSDMAIEKMQGASDIISQGVTLAADVASREHEVKAKKDEAKIPSGSDNT